LSAVSIFSAQAQYDFNHPQPVVKAADPHNRAKIHTELGSMYFQAGNPGSHWTSCVLLVSADANYYQAYSVRGLVMRRERIWQG
jgi:type IV pilus assembly protein PilF